MKQWKYQPAGDGGTYYQKFPNPYTLVLPGDELTLHVPIAGGGTILRPYVFEEEYLPGSTSDSGTLTAEAVYVGYGATAPELGYDDYQGVDVKGKIVGMEPEAPVTPDPDPELFKKWRPYTFHDYKVKNAAAHGAAGMIYDYHIANPNCVFVKGFQLMYVGRAVMEDLFSGTGRKHADVVAQIRKTRAPASMPLGKTVTMKNATEYHAEGVGSNVIAWIEGIVILFGAEEQGVKGSEFSVAHPFMPNENVKAFINLESVGRGERIGVGSGRNYPAILEVMERVNTQYVHRPITANLNANLARPRQDAAHFLWAGIPTVSIGTSGAPPLPYATYHTTKDRWETLTPEIMEDFARLVFLSVVELANR